MGVNAIQGTGNKVKLFIAALPLGSRTSPSTTATTITTHATAIASGSTTVTLVSALTIPIAAYMPITFIKDNADPTPDVIVTVYLTADAKVGDTVLNVETTTVEIPASSAASYVGRLRLLGGTQSGKQISMTSSDFQVFEDEAGFMDGIITQGEWSIPWTANIKPDDPGYNILDGVNIKQALEGRELYAWQELKIPGYTNPKIIKGAVSVEDYSEDYPADGVLTFTCTFKGRGTPATTKFS